jgi:hypothetical protein
MGAAVLIAGVAFAQDAQDHTRMAAADSASFAKLDADQDGRVSAIEAATDSKVAAGFTQADADKDGYLSRAEFANLGKSSMGDDTQRPSSPHPQSDSSTPPEESTTAPPQ